MMRVRLKINGLQIHRSKERWKLYFIVITEHPSERGKMVMTTLPQKPIRLSNRHENIYQFNTGFAGSEGLLVFSRELPKNRELNVYFYLMHTRQLNRDLVDLLQKVECEIGGDAFGIVKNIMGTSSVSWLVITQKAVPKVEKSLAKITDRSFGFVNAHERFGTEFENAHKLDYTKDFSGGASVAYSWSVIKINENSITNESGII